MWNRNLPMTVVLLAALAGCGGSASRRRNVDVTVDEPADLGAAAAGTHVHGTGASAARVRCEGRPHMPPWRGSDGCPAIRVSGG